MKYIYLLLIPFALSCSKDNEITPDDNVVVEYYVEGHQDGDSYGIAIPLSNGSQNLISVHTDSDGLILKDTIPALFRIRFSAEKQQQPESGARIYIKHNGKEVVSTSDYIENDYGRFIAEIRNVSIWEKVYIDK